MYKFIQSFCPGSDPSVSGFFVAPNTSDAPSRMAPHVRVGSRKSLCIKIYTLSELVQRAEPQLFDWFSKIQVAKTKKMLCIKFCALSQLSWTPQKDTLMQDFGVENKTFLHTKSLCTRICILPKLFQRAKLGVQGAENPCV